MSDEIIDVPEFMDRVQEDKDLLKELLDIFVEDFEQKREKLTEAAATKDFETIKSIAHSIKGASGNISAKPLRAVTIKLETRGSEKNASDLDMLLKDLDREYAALKTRIVTLKKEL
ncbi:MAG: Hpt domain-containing protein [Candidatus Omnitrophica bacterium]|nr:Hpt domain-containing protein [Candidatus Omnitrophota bacterium]